MRTAIHATQPGLLMRTYKQVKREHFDEVLEAIICDLCKRSVHPRREWAADAFDVAETEVKMTTGTAYPDNGHSVKLSYDICPDCFKTKIMPWMAQKGAKPTETESDW